MSAKLKWVELGPRSRSCRPRGAEAQKQASQSLGAGTHGCVSCSQLDVLGPAQLYWRSMPLVGEEVRLSRRKR